MQMMNLNQQESQEPSQILNMFAPTSPFGNYIYQVPNQNQSQSDQFNFNLFQDQNPQNQIFNPIQVPNGENQNKIELEQNKFDQNIINEENGNEKTIPNIQRMQKNYICKSDIKTLKADLMGKRRRSNRSNRNAKNNSFYSNRSMSNISSQYFSLRNDEIGQDFEENIRNILIMDYNWKERNIKRKFKFREILYRFKKRFIITGQKNCFYKS